MDSDENYMNEEYAHRLRELSEALELNDQALVNQLVGELTTIRESALFQELGKLTREIHESINSFGEDDRIAALANVEIPDAKERLQYVVEKTDEAAHRTMTGVEASLKLIDGLKTESESIQQRWQLFKNRELSKEDFVQLSSDLELFFQHVEESSGGMGSHLTDVMLAQDYQDLTGQMIKRVITMVREVEEKLVHLVAISGAKVQENQSNVDDAKGHGPQLASADNAEVARSQDDVDDLLASLGF